MCQTTCKLTNIQHGVEGRIQWLARVTYQNSLSMIDREIPKRTGCHNHRTCRSHHETSKGALFDIRQLHEGPCSQTPQLHSEMTSLQFRKFRIDWEVFVRMTNMPPAQTNIQLYNCADEAVQTSIINTYPKFFSEKSNRLMDMLEALVTQKSNPRFIDCLLPQFLKD